MKNEKAKNPLIIYIAETNHGDLSYPSVAEKIIKACYDRRLKTSVFSEFGNKEKGLGSEDEKSLVGYFPQGKINQFVNERCVPMGNVFNRFDKLIPEAEKTFLENITPSQIFEQRKGYVDNPETLKLLEAEIDVRKNNQEKGIGTVSDQDLDGKDFWNKGNKNAFVQTTAHQEMAKDVYNKRTGQEDVIIMIAGAPHIYGLDKALDKVLGSTFQNCKKLVVGNFKEFTVDSNNLESIENAKKLCGKKSCEEVGKVIRFDKVAENSDEAVLPDEIEENIEELATQKKSQNSNLSFVTKFASKKTGSQEEESFAKRFNAEKVKNNDGNTTGGGRV